jgi:hypothetical protein
MWDGAHGIDEKLIQDFDQKLDHLEDRQTQTEE